MFRADPARQSEKADFHQRLRAAPLPIERDTPSVGFATQIIPPSTNHIHRACIFFSAGPVSMELHLCNV
ncbi:hypothetical protein ACN9OK_11900, partial [Glaesserella parasuis]|uniref:hypothetical protein n=1 Tax=Glaesserella parasuis TaxID=738 RepID=UPI003B67B338